MKTQNIFLIITSLIMFGCVSQSQVNTAASQQVHEQGRSAHSLDPLTADEIKTAINILYKTQKANLDTRFGLIELNEPEKRDIRDKSVSVNRSAYILMFDWKRRLSSEAVVDLSTKNVVSWRKLETRQPPNTYLIVERIEEIVFADPRWKKAMSVRNLDNIDVITLWPDLLPYQKLTEKHDNFVIGAVALNNNASSAQGRYLNLDIEVDLTDGKVTGFIDKGLEIMLLDRPKQFIPKLSNLDKEVSNKDATFYQAGRNFKISGTQLDWGNWRFNFSINPRRGLEIYNVRYLDEGRERSILYRASLSEIVTPYGDPGWYSWYPSDEGDLNFADYALVPTTEHDVLPNAVFRPAITHDSRGNTKVVQRSVAIFEKYSGLLWRHYQESRRAKDLVLSSHYMVDNYDYVLSWVFRQNGSISVEITLTGMINYGLTDKQRVAAEDLTRPVMSHTLVAPGVYGPIHQHFFNFRLDFDIDGSKNTVAEVNSLMLPKGSVNPDEEWFASAATIFESEKQAMRQIDPRSSRKWKVFNSNTKNSLGQRPSYFIIPKDNTFPLPGPNSKVRDKAGFVNAHLWVTPYSSQEMYAAGKYLGAGFNSEGLPKWVQADRDIKNRDIVVWYTLGTTHMPRPEDWPVMPSKTISFEIMPFGFFTKSPALH